MSFCLEPWPLCFLHPGLVFCGCPREDRYTVLFFVFLLFLPKKITLFPKNVPLCFQSCWEDFLFFLKKCPLRVREITLTLPSWLFSGRPERCWVCCVV